MQQPSSDTNRIYWVIIGLSTLLCFAWMMTGNFFLTLAVLILGALHLAREFAVTEEIIASDPLLRWLRTASPLIIIGIFGFVLLSTWYR